MLAWKETRTAPKTSGKNDLEDLKVSKTLCEEHGISTSRKRSSNVKASAPVLDGGIKYESLKSQSRNNLKTSTQSPDGRTKSESSERVSSSLGWKNQLSIYYLTV